MWQRSVPASRAAGITIVENLLDAGPNRSDVWAELSPADQEIMTIWLGLPRSPLLRRDRRYLAASALDFSVAAVVRLLHHRPTLTMPADFSNIPPY